MSYSEGWGDKIEDPDYYARLGIHGPYEYTDYMPSLEAGTLLLESSTLKEFTRFIRSDNCTGLNHLPFVPTCCSLYPVERLLGEVYRLSEFETMARDLEKKTGKSWWDRILEMWTLAYYTGWGCFDSGDVFLCYDGADFTMPALFNYAGSFMEPCEYERVKPPRRAFQCNWHYFSENVHKLKSEPPYLRQAIQHFTNLAFYR